ncbi:MAG: polyprenol phosphomannose-dependent alpha 1,6 mannosyltransferase MptB [Micropruina sp.]|nr:polyprenol phosphomannose-dependent alpha 1,6 mannosyltransferase MptB [Micropruina sp.]
MGHSGTRFRFARPERLRRYGYDVGHAWKLGPVKQGFIATSLLHVGSLTPAYLPQNSPWWEPIRALSLDVWPAKLVGTALVIAAVALLIDAWFKLRPTLYHEVKHWPICLIWSLPLLLAPPIFSHDAYSYAAQGWLLHNGLNPYETSVSVLPGAFADQVAYVWRYTPAPYGPLSLQLSHLLVLAAGLNPYYSAVMMRLPALLGVAMIVYLLPRIAHRIKVDPQVAAWFTTINPLLIIDFVGGAHNDALMMGLIVLAIWLALHGQFWQSAILVGVAAAVKQPAFLAAYTVALVGRPWGWHHRQLLPAVGRALVSAGVAIATFAAISVATGLNFGWINALDVPGRVVTLAPMSLVGEGIRLLFVQFGQPALGSRIAGGLLVTGVVASALVVGWLAVTLARKRPVAFLSWSYLAVAIGGPALHSWYLLWGGALLPLTKPSERVTRVAVIVTAVLLGYAAGNLAYRNDTGIGLGLGALALVTTMVVRHVMDRRRTLREAHSPTAG